MSTNYALGKLMNVKNIQKKKNQDGCHTFINNSKTLLHIGVLHKFRMAEGLDRLERYRTLKPCTQFFSFVYEIHATPFAYSWF